MESKEKGLKNTTVILMIGTAVFFDIVQFILTYIFLGWLAGIYAGLTFFTWMKIHGINFMRPKRFMAFGGTYILEVIPFLSILPGWTITVSYLTLSSKIQEIVPGANITKLGLSAAGGKPNVLQFKPRQAASSTPSLKKAA